MPLLWRNDERSPRRCIAVHVDLRSLPGSDRIGRLGRGERLPTVRQTARDLGVSPGTTGRAYKQREQDGLAVIRTGAGTRLSDNASPVLAEIADLARSLARTTAHIGVDPPDMMASLRAELASSVTAIVDDE